MKKSIISYIKNIENNFLFWYKNSIYRNVAHRLFGVVGINLSDSSPWFSPVDIRPGRLAGVEESGGMVDRLISDPSPDSPSDSFQVEVDSWANCVVPDSTRLVH